MKARPTNFARAATLASLLIAGAASAQTAPEVASAMAKGREPAPYPKLSEAPPSPKDVRSVSAWREAVTALKADGADVVRLADATPWTLSGTDAWAEGQRELARPPPPVTQPDLSTEAFAQRMRAEATPPKRRAR